MDKYTEEEVGTVLAEGSLAEVADSIVFLAFVMGLDPAEGFESKGLDDSELLEQIDNAIEWLNDTAVSGACEIVFDGSKVEVVGL
jgi:hypothetical protein